MINTRETICAPATGHGGSIAIIRMSGGDSISICDKVFRAADKGKELASQKGNTIIYGHIHDSDDIIDDVLVSVFFSPNSYTGEDSVEISCHASSYIQKRILELLLRNGAIMARAGEFTQRAFLNGKMDLAQAEAVADVIASSTAAAHKLAINQMRGGVSEEISRLRKELLHFTSLIELELDFGEEDVVFADRGELLAIVTRVKEISDKLAGSFRLGNAIKNGIPVAIVGKPNSGKSTLLNALLREDKAIVSEIAGTTRDVIEDNIVIDGIDYRFIDTAGLRDTTDVIEIIGIRKTHEKIGQAMVVLLIDEINDDPAFINKRADNLRDIISQDDKKLIILINKADLASKKDYDKLAREIRMLPGEALLFISAKENKGLDELKALLGGIVGKERFNSGDVILTNMRHYEALISISGSLGRVEEGLRSGIPEDLVAIDIRQAIHYLGEITGEITNDEILGNIFKNFCIGK